MFRKGLAKKITTVITAAVLTVMAVVPAMAAGTPDKGTIYPIGSITSAKSHELASRVTMSRDKYPYSALYLLSWENDYEKMFGTTEKIVEQLGNSYKEGADVELIGLVGYNNDNLDFYDTLEFNITNVEAGAKIVAIAIKDERTGISGPGNYVKKTFVCDTTVDEDDLVKVSVTKDMMELTKSKYYRCDFAFVRMSGVSDDSQASSGTVTSKPKDEFSEDAKLTDEDGNEVKAEDVKSVVTALDETKTAEVKETLAKNDVTIAEDAAVDYVDIKLNDSNNKVVVLSNGTVVVTVPAKENMSADKYTVKVYHIKADGTMETVPAELTSEGVKITATSFSPYVIVYEAKASTETPSTSKDDISTGDSMMVIYASFAMVLALAGAAAYSKKRA